MAGNQTLDKVTANAIRVLELAGRGDVPVAAGADRPLAGELVVAADAHGETGLDGPELPPAGARPVAQRAPTSSPGSSLDSDDPVTLVATGPLTNVALLLDAHPEAGARLGGIVLMGGAIAEGNQTASAEYNVWLDPEAAARVFASGLDLTMVGLDVTNRAVLTPEHADLLRGRAPSAGSRRDARLVRGLLREVVRARRLSGARRPCALVRPPAGAPDERSTAMSRSSLHTASAAAAPSST